MARTTGRALAVFGLLTLLILFTPLVSWWTRLYAGSIAQPEGQILILLSAAEDDNGGISYSSYWRARQAIHAWQTGGFQKIVVTGGRGPGIENYLFANGVPRSAVLAEWQSQSTRQNALNVAKLIRKLPGRRVLLTSDFHMFRAIRVFRKVGIDATPMAVPDVLSRAEHWYSRPGAFLTMTLESVKIVYYALRGWL